MPRAVLHIAGVATIILLLGSAAPAHAGYGAIAYDQMTGSYGSSSNEPSAARANELALKNCASPKLAILNPKNFIERTMRRRIYRKRKRSGSRVN